MRKTFIIIEAKIPGLTFLVITPYMIFCVFCYNHVCTSCLALIRFFMILLETERNNTN